MSKPPAKAKPVRKVHRALRHYLSPGQEMPRLKGRRRLGASHDEAACPGCGAMRPGFCLTFHPELGLRCDGCVSGARREGKLHDFDHETPEPDRPVDAPAE